MSATRIGRPLRVATATRLMSSIARKSPIPRTTSDSSPRRSSPPPALLLAFASACATWSMVTACFFIRNGSSLTWYSLSVPPKLITSATPGTIRRYGRTIQSWIARTSYAGIPGGASIE